MKTCFGGLREDFLSYQKLLLAMFLQKNSVIQPFAANMLMCEFLL